MANDLASTPATGIRVQCCGDAHLCNFGGFATPERRVIFALNDLDETLPAPWEWDVKRLAASFVVACRDNGLSNASAKDVVMTCVRTYRKSMAEFSHMKTLELWHFALGVDELVAAIKDPTLKSKIRASLLDLSASFQVREMPGLIAIKKMTSSVPAAARCPPEPLHVRQSGGKVKIPGRQVNSGYNIARMRFEIILAPEAVQDLKGLKAHDRAAVRDAIAHLLIATNPGIA